METRKDSGGPGSSAAGVSGSSEPSSSADISHSVADVDVGRLKTRVPFDVDEIDLLLGTVPFHLLRCSELEKKFGKEAFKSWYDEAAKNKEKYLAKYPDGYSSGTDRQAPQGAEPKESVDYESLSFDTTCDAIPEIIRAYNEAHLEEDEIGCDVTKEAVERSKVEYKRLNELLKNYGTPPPWLEDDGFWMDSKEPHRPKKLEDWVQSEAEWAEFSLEVEREVDIVKAMCKDEQYNPVVRKPLSWLDQFVGAVEKETGITFDEEFAKHMADLAAGKDSDISINAHARSLGVGNLAVSDNSDDEQTTTLGAGTGSAPNLKEPFPGMKTPVKKAPDPVMLANLGEPPSVEEPYSLEKELQSYVGRKTLLLLSRVHDDGKIKWKKDKDKEARAEREVPNLEIDEWYFGPKEFIVLKDEGGKKTRTDIVVDRDEDLCEKIAVIEGVPAKKRSKLMSTRDVDKNYFLKRLLTPRYLKELGIETGEPDEIDDEEQILNTQPTSSPKQEVRCEVLEPVEEDRERRLQRRKLFRWERFRFRDSLEITEADPKSTSTEDSKPVIEVTKVPQTQDTAETRAARRRQIADSLFQDDSKKYVEYVDPSEMTGWELHRPLPIMTAASLSHAYVPEVVPVVSMPDPSKSKTEPEQPTVPSEQPILFGGAKVPSVTSAAVSARDPGPTAVDPALSKSDGPVPKKDKVGSKKDKKKKKRKSSSSSDDDLEMLEKKSEARLGLRK